jgi:uncharacterized protein (TIGR03083 family)
MDYRTYVEHVRADGDRLASEVDGHLDLAVPSCPGWTLRDLANHVAEVYEHKIVCTQLGRQPDPWPPAWPADRDPVEWFRDAHGRILEMFDAHGPDDPSATWWPPDQSVGFWARRMAQETAVHRADADLAVDRAPVIDPDLATDGVDEILVIMLAGDWSDDPAPESGTQLVTVATGERRWLVTLEPETVAVSEAEAGADANAAVEGDPSSVLLWLWGRAGDDQASLSGSPSALRLMRQRLVLATQ